MTLADSIGFIFFQLSFSVYGTEQDANSEFNY